MKIALLVATLVVFGISGWLGMWYQESRHGHEVRQLERRVVDADAQVDGLQNQLDSCLVRVKISGLSKSVDENTRAANRAACAVALMSQAKGRISLPGRLAIIRDSCKDEL